MVSEMCDYDSTLVCLKKSTSLNQNRKCLTCHIYLNRTKEFDERLTEPQIREEIFKIIREEIEKTIPYGKPLDKNLLANMVTSDIRERIHELLNKHEVILVYQP